MLFLSASPTAISLEINFTIAPKASLSDGLLDIVIVKKMNKFSLPFSVLSPCGRQ